MGRLGAKHPSGGRGQLSPPCPNVATCLRGITFVARMTLHPPRISRKNYRNSGRPDTLRLSADDEPFLSFSRVARIDERTRPSQRTLNELHADRHAQQVPVLLIQSQTVSRQSVSQYILTKSSRPVQVNPSAEFFSRISAELQKFSTDIWISRIYVKSLKFGQFVHAIH